MTNEFEVFRMRSSISTWTALKCSMCENAGCNARGNSVTDRRSSLGRARTGSSGENEVFGVKEGTGRELAGGAAPDRASPAARHEASCVAVRIARALSQSRAVAHGGFARAHVDCPPPRVSRGFHGTPS
jgi:hypothetical protein